jgi:hypothetical protein
MIHSLESAQRASRRAAAADRRRRQLAHQGRMDEWFCLGRVGVLMSRARRRLVAFLRARVAARRAANLAAASAAAASAAAAAAAAASTNFVLTVDL